MSDSGLYTKIRRTDSDPVLGHAGLVKRVARHLAVRLPAFMDLDELVQVGMIGLFEARESFDPSKGVDFESFALARVRGAMLDEARRLSAQPRSAVEAKRRLSDAADSLSRTLGRAPRDAEIAAHLQLDAASFHKERMQAGSFETVSIHDDEGFLELPDLAEREPERTLERKQAIEELADALDGLPERDRTIVALYYVEELNLKEIGAVMGIGESRVSQILSACVKKLRAVMAEP